MKGTALSWVEADQQQSCGQGGKTDSILWNHFLQSTVQALCLDSCAIHEGLPCLKEFLV